MIILSTEKTKDNNYFANTQTRAIVHLTRKADPSENETAIDVTVEELGTINDIIVQSKDADNTYGVENPTITISGNVININTVESNAIYTIFAIGTR